MSAFGFSDRHLAELTSILQSIPAIETAIIFGSRARGDNKPASDVDLALTGAHLTHRDVARLDDKLYYSYLPFFFDTLILDKTHSPIRDSINRDGRILYRRSESQAASPA